MASRGGGHDGFLRAVAVLVGGTTGGNLIAAACMPLLTRLYTPADFGLLAVFTAILTTVSVAACLRWDIAIALPTQERDAFGLLSLSVLSACIISLVALLIVVIWPSFIARVVGQPELEAWLWLLPFGILSAATNSAFQSWNIRHRAFSLISKLKVGQSLTSATIQLAGGLLSVGPIGLLAGYVANSAVAAAFLAKRLVGQQEARPKFTGRELRTLANEYRRFPGYSTWEALANNASIQVPIVMIAAAIGREESGYLSIAIYVIQMPMGLIGAAVSQVYLSSAPHEHREGRLQAFTSGVLVRLFKAGFPPLVAVGVVSPFVFEYFFGPGWGRAGVLVAWMTPWFLLQFLASPVSMALHITGQQRAAMLLQFFGLALRVAAVVAAASWWPQRILEAYGLSGAVFYGVYLVVVLRAVSAAPGAGAARADQTSEA